MKWNVERRRALYKGAAVTVGVLLLCCSFLAVPYIASAIPAEFGSYLTEETPPTPLAALRADGKPYNAGTSSTDSLPSDASENESSREESDEPATPPEPPEGALTVFADSFCWYTDPAEATLDIINRTNYTVDLKEYLTRQYPVSLSPGSQEDEPIVLILHTHGSESYLPAGVDYYLPEEDFRSDDPKETVVSVGDMIAETLESLGIPVLHDRTMHDLMDFNNAYTESRAAAREALAEHPTIRYILDIHRDSIFTQNNICEKTLTEIDGKQTAQVMLVVGTNQDGAAHPDWRQNLTVATKLEELLNNLYPTLARPVNLRSSAFNQALSPGALLVEVGSCGNTIEEAREAGRLFAISFATLLHKNHRIPTKSY
ncbi:MAG: stage II sporulation protein P [Oscillospiraceae bacterium]|nr:stage II sporulation protein P [Oscillospiraceae bacterium]